MDSDIFKRDIRGILAEKSASESARGREHRDISDGGIALDSVEAELVVSDVLKSHIPKIAERVVGGAGLDLAGVAVIFY